MIRSFLFSAARAKAPPANQIFDPQDLWLARRDENEGRIRALADNAYLGQGRALCRVLGRYKMFVDTADIGLSSHLLLDGYWELWLAEALRSRLRPGMTVVDVGANLGYYTLLMADFVGDTGHVHAFEPNPPILDLLRRNVAVNGFHDRVTLHAEPLGAVAGEPVAIVVPAGEPKNAHVVPVTADADGALHTRRLDEVAALTHADIVKIDAEGAEYAIWQGMAGLLARSARPLTIYLEFTTNRYPDPRAFLNQIAASGFAFEIVTLGHGVQPVLIADILAAPAHVDQLLVLSRG